jgi:8-oxo-dGTP pyrophosphatase MutT (NUDIX family)
MGGLEMDADLPSRLAARLKQSLPGRRAQALFEPEMSYGRHFGPPAVDATTAAVLVLLYPVEGQWFVPLTTRPATMVVHAGQISLPGGRVESGETPKAAVFRELEEELGVPRQGTSVLGQLSSLYLYGSNFIVLPWVAAVDARPDFRPSPAEVSELLEVPLAHLIDPAHAGSHARRQRGVAINAPHFLWGRHRIWGATSMILAELVAIVREMENE